MELYILDEARNAACAREMMEKGDLIVPTFNYEIRVDKPPLHYYFMILAYYLIGFSEFSARIFSSLAGAGTVLATYLFTAKYLGRKPAFWASLALLSSLHFALEFHLAVPDPYLILFMVSSIFLLFHGYESGRSLFIFSGYAAVGLAAMAKGPVAIALPGTIFMVFLLVNREFTWSSLSRLKLVHGALIIMLIVVPWTVAVWIETEGEWVRRFLLEQNISRFVETKEGHGGSFLLPTSFVIIGLLPFALYLPQAVVAAWSARATRSIQLCIISGAVVIVFFSIAQTKLPNYILPGLPFLAVIIGFFMGNGNLSRAKIWINYVVYTLIMMGIPLTLYFILGGMPYLSQSTRLAWGFTVLPLGGLIGLTFVFRNRFLWAHFSLVGSFILANLYFFYSGYPGVYDKNPVAVSLQQMEDGVPVLYYKQVNQAFTFHLERKVPCVKSSAQLLEFLHDRSRVYVLSRKEYWEEIEDIGGMSLIYDGTDTFEKPVTILVEYAKMME